MDKIKHGDLLFFPESDSTTHCVICERKIGKSAKLVAVVDGGSVWSAAFGQPDETDAGYMGYYTVGSAKCAAMFETGVLFDQQ